MSANLSNIKYTYCNNTPLGQPESIELPVAPRTNARTRFSPMEVMQPHTLQPMEARNWLRGYMEHGKAIERIGIVGPGDPLATIDITFETLQLIKQDLPEVSFYIKTLGIGGEKYADQLAKLGVTHVEMQIDSLDTEILKKIYAWIRPGFKTLALPEAVEILKLEQEKAICAFKDVGMKVTAVTTLYPDNNINHVKKIAPILSKMGVDDMLLEPYITSDNTEITLNSITENILRSVSDSVAKHITLQKGRKLPSQAQKADKSELFAKPSKERPNIAVVSSNGIEVDLHLGHAIQVLIYGPREDGLVCLLELRPAPEPGGGSSRWDKLADHLQDCFTILAAHAGDKPQQILAQKGISTLLTEDNIEGTIEVLYGLDKKKKTNQ
ncbi:MAG: radical SAM protein [Desulfotalea sp.]